MMTGLSVPKASQLIQAIDSVVVGKQEQIQMAVACLLAGGHLLLEDVPGVGKTTLATALAQSLGLDYSRVQFTSDLMPSDLLGMSVFDKGAEQFVFHPGPVFSQVVLADEINRAASKTQSALLECMEEGKVSVDGKSMTLPVPFFVIATQNPLEQIGTNALPESQLDRFMCRISLGYPDPSTERALILRNGSSERLKSLGPVMTLEHFKEMQDQVTQMHVGDEAIDILHRLVLATRSNEKIRSGLSPRGAISYMQFCRGLGFIRGRDFVTEDDVYDSFSACCIHRMSFVGGPLGHGDGSSSSLLRSLLATSRART